jgi:competence ComEA-like helix-hairpin-helix protein
MKQLTLLVPVLFSSLAVLSSAPAAKAQDLPEGKGKDLVDQVCGSCHGTDLVSARRATKEGWGYIVDDMVSRGASASNDQVQTIKEYLAKNFGQVNVNKADAAEIASVLEITPAQAEAIVKYRGDHPPYKSLDDVKKAPGLETAKLDNKKDRLAY